MHQPIRFGTSYTFVRCRNAAIDAATRMHFDSKNAAENCFDRRKRTDGQPIETLYHAPKDFGYSRSRFSAKFTFNLTARRILPQPKLLLLLSTYPLDHLLPPSVPSLLHIFAQSTFARLPNIYTTCSIRPLRTSHSTPTSFALHTHTSFST